MHLLWLSECLGKYGVEQHDGYKKGRKLFHLHDASINYYMVKFRHIMMNMVTADKHAVLHVNVGQIKAAVSPVAPRSNVEC
jgi:hypothetical protein